MTKTNTQGKVFLIPSLLAPDTQHKIITEQVKDVVKHVQHFFVEDIRTARRFISSLKLGITIENLHFTQLNKKTTITDLTKDLSPLLQGNDIGIISEAGLPAVADPGHVLVAWAHSKDIQVIPLVGASSLMMALMASGFNGQNFAFSGYLPIQILEQQKAIAELEKTMYQAKQTQIFMETPFRNNKLVANILKVCKNTTLLCIASNITGENEYIKTKTIEAWKKNIPDLHKQPTIFLLYC